MWLYVVKKQIESWECLQCCANATDLQIDQRAWGPKDKIICNMFSEF